MATPVATADVRMQVEKLIADKTQETGRSIEFWDAETLDAFLIEALRISVPQAFKSKFYQERFDGFDAQIDTLEHFESLPFTFPPEVKNRLNELLACSWEDVAQINMSSGTTGGPTTYVAYTKEDLRGDGAYYAPGGLFKFDKTDLAFVALPYDMATVGLSIHRDVQRQGGIVLPAGKGGTYSSPERLVQAIHDLKPTTLFSTPSYAYYLHELYTQTFPDAPHSIKYLRVGGEGASPAMRQKLAEVWNGEVTQWYGSTETSIIAYSCEHGDYHLCFGNTYMEIVGEDGRSVPKGETGEVVLTTLGRVATPIVRYKNGDVGRILDEPCTCGRTLPRFQMFGRGADQIPFGLDQSVSPYLIEHLLLDIVPNAKPWYHIALRDYGIVLVAERPDLDDAALQAATRQLEAAIHKASGLELAGVEWAAVGTLDRPRTKMRRVKDESER